MRLDSQGGVEWRRSPEAFVISRQKVVEPQYEAWRSEEGKGYRRVPHRYRKYEQDGFDTPSRKLELYSSVFQAHGYDPRPHFKEPPESHVSRPDLARAFPLILITGGRAVEYFHSKGRQIAELRKRKPDPEIEIHPETAEEAGIREGGWVWVETVKVEGERVKLKARHDPELHPQVVHADHGWWFPEKEAPEHGCFESNINAVLSGDPPRDEICASVPTRGTLCKVYRC